MVAPATAVSLISTTAIALVAVMLVLHVVFCSRHRLYLCDNGIAVRGIRKIVEVSFADVVHLKWRSDGFGSAVLRADPGRITINLARYEPEASLRIVRHLQSAIPDARQEDWNLFCLRIAMPLRSPGCIASRSDRLFSRALFDRLCGSLLFVELAFGIGEWLLGFGWKASAVSCAITVIGWFTTRLFVPKEWTIDARWFPLGISVDLAVNHLSADLCRMGVLLLCCELVFALPPNLPRIGGIVIVVLIVGVVVEALYQLIRSGLKCWRAFGARRTKDLSACEAAVREWESLDLVLAATP
ncbi:MAG TPA: hypothetical protein VGP63_15960 [Planctomycetaceae bacterium]|nr:hypothetical protein [Planctomycetaceae bacterium]